MRRNAFARFFEDLFAGDPVALTIVAVFAGLLLLFGLYWLKTVRDLKREEEERKRKRAGKTMKSKVRD